MQVHKKSEDQAVPLNAAERSFASRRVKELTTQIDMLTHQAQDAPAEVNLVELRHELRRLMLERQVWQSMGG